MGLLFRNGLIHSTLLPIQLKNLDTNFRYNVILYIMPPKLKKVVDVPIM